MTSTSKYFAEGSLIADSRETANSLMVITSGQVGVELPMDSAEADEENKSPNGKTLLYIFGRGYVILQGHNLDISLWIFPSNKCIIL
jgi:hypothetical protein